ncbi:hypothetical protein LTR94_028954, partial [Friedmanniomyces endolithicus]
MRLRRATVQKKAPAERSAGAYLYWRGDRCALGAVLAPDAHRAGSHNRTRHGASSGADAHIARPRYRDLKVPRGPAIVDTAGSPDRHREAVASPFTDLHAPRTSNGDVAGAIYARHLDTARASDGGVQASRRSGQDGSRTSNLGFKRAR